MLGSQGQACYLRFFKEQPDVFFGSGESEIGGMSQVSFDFPTPKLVIPS